MKRTYEVFHRLMRDAQVYTGDSLSDDIDLYDEEHEKNWQDFKRDPLVDVVLAENAFDAVSAVETETGYHASNLYAVEHITSARGEIKVLNKRVPFRFEASTYDDGQLCGIEVLMPDGRTALIALNYSNHQVSLTVNDPENPDKAPEIINL